MSEKQRQVDEYKKSILMDGADAYTEDELCMAIHGFKACQDIMVAEIDSLRTEYNHLVDDCNAKQLKITRSEIALDRLFEMFQALPNSYANCSVENYEDAKTEIYMLIDKMRRTE